MERKGTCYHFVCPEFYVFSGSIHTVFRFKKRHQPINSEKINLTSNMMKKKRTNTEYVLNVEFSYNLESLIPTILPKRGLVADLKGESTRWPSETVGQGCETLTRSYIRSYTRLA